MRHMQTELLTKEGHPDMQLSPYPYYELARLNRWLKPMLMLAAALSIAGLIHGFSTLYVIAPITESVDLAQLGQPLQSRLNTDLYLRAAQIGVTLIALVFFFTIWLYMIARNLNLLHDMRRCSAKNSLIIYTRMTLGIAFALRMMLAYWKNSLAPDSELNDSRALVPVWWTVLIAANVFKIISVVLLSQAISLGDWQNGFGLMIIAYALYLLLYALTWKLAQGFAARQREHWQYKNAQTQAAQTQAAQSQTAASPGSADAASGPRAESLSNLDNASGQKR